MIRKNQEFLNRLNVAADGLLIYLMMPLSYWIRFRVLEGGIETLPLPAYLRLGVAVTAVMLFTCAAFGVYNTSRRMDIRDEAAQILKACLVDAPLLPGWLYLGHNEHYSRIVLALFFALSAGALVCKHVLVRRALRSLRRRGRNLKHVLLIGSGAGAEKYLAAIRQDRELGYEAAGYAASKRNGALDIPYLGGIGELEALLEQMRPDEAVCALGSEEYGLTPRVIACCEKAGVKLSIIPFYSEYIPAHPQFDNLGGIPLMNIRGIPLDGFGNAFLKRAGDIAGSLLLLVLLSPLLVFCAIGVKLSSPGPVFFKQTRIGRDRKPFTMLKFRSMRVNSRSDTAWSKKSDGRRTRFGSFLRKTSLDELPQLFCCLAGTMSLVGPRPEIPYFADRFREEIPLYMVRHQVRPGMTGWAQIHGFRGDTPIRERVEHDIWYIENWSVLLDLRILFVTLLCGKFINEESMEG